ncbi:MAG: SusD/RagB family nutrient-binding outer membrane lipoprotein, partial [bacterium]
MKNEIRRISPLILGVIFLFGLLNGCGDFLDNPAATEDPNRPIAVEADQLFNAVQVGTWFMMEGALARTFTIWMQQMAGTDRQLVGYSKYEITEADHDVEFDNVYTGGGLIDIRHIIQQTTDNNWLAYRGIAKIYEALLIGTTASIWGDIPYSQAVNPQYPEPKLDEQADVYAAVQNLLDEAIQDLQSSGEQRLPPNDHVYGGDLTKWIEMAHSLKARFYMHWAEVDQTNYQLALQQAQQGISSIAGDYKSIHSVKESESNTWYQFCRERDS